MFIVVLLQVKSYKQEVVGIVVVTNETYFPLQI